MLFYISRRGAESAEFERLSHLIGNLFIFSNWVKETFKILTVMVFFSFRFWNFLSLSAPLREIYIGGYRFNFLTL